MRADVMDPAARDAEGPVLSVTGLTVEISGEAGRFPVVSDMDLAVRRGETVCIVGESGCGKSMTALALLRLLPEGARITAGSIMIADEDLTRLDQRRIPGLDPDVALLDQPRDRAVRQH